VPGILHALQRQVGNSGLQRIINASAPAYALLRRRADLCDCPAEVQLLAAPSVSHPQDPAEREADRVADEVMRTPSGHARPAPAAPADTVWARSARPLDGVATDHAALIDAACRSGGQSLPPESRDFMESRFGRDFSNVRVHADPAAGELARQVGARAFTTGNHVFFAPGEFQPDRKPGQHLLAHELTHVVQQRGTADGQDNAADRRGLANGLPAVTAHTPQIQRQGLPGMPVRVVRVEVRRDHRGHFPQVPGTGAGTHWVGVASSTAATPVVQAVVAPPVPGTDPGVAGLTWSGTDVISDPANPLEAQVSRASAGKREVTATLGTSSARTTLWAVFANIRATSGPSPTFASDAAAAFPGATVKFAADIFPASILAGDRPKLDGPNDTPPPGGVSPATGNPLSGGADHHWDFSRKSREKIINPNGIPLASMTLPGDADMARFFANAPWDYPVRWEEGNDDSSTDDETNDPYGPGMTSKDSPTDALAHTGGSDGDTFEDRIQFQEFVRLELDKTWWVISHMFPWRFHGRVRKVAGSWVNNATSAAPDNAGW
jgi:hypothetical protein